MHRSDVMATLTIHKGELIALGAAHLSLFGSVARDQAGNDSDVDIIVDSIGGQPLGLFRLARISDALERLLARPVDLISRSGLNHARRLKQQVADDLVDVF